MKLFILLFIILTAIFLLSFIKLINNNKNSNNIKLIVGTIMFTIFIICTTNMTLLISNDTNRITKIINDYKPLIQRNSIISSRFDEDLKQELETRICMKLKKNKKI